MRTTASLQSALLKGPLSAGDLRSHLNVSRPTLARTLAEMQDEIVTWGAARATHYALKDRQRGLGDIPVYRVNASGQIEWLGTLCPVRPAGFVMQQADGGVTHYEGLPWWLSDMRPQGFLGRAFAHQHANALGLPPDVRYWSDTDAVRALLANGVDGVGNLLLGDAAKDRFVNAADPSSIGPDAYPLCSENALGLGESWSSAGGEQPKFCAFTERGHVLVKFSVPSSDAVATRWRDLLLAEHHALATLASKGASAAVSRVVDIGSQRFLEIQRFDRLGSHGRHTVLSLASLDSEFVGKASAPWPVVTSALSKKQIITEQAHAQSTLLYAFGTLIGNTDMHGGNLSFMGSNGTPYTACPAYDVLPMAFSPTSGGALRDALAPAHLHPSVPGETWRAAQKLATNYLQHLRKDPRFTPTFQACISALEAHLAAAVEKIGRIL